MSKVYKPIKHLEYKRQMGLTATWSLIAALLLLFTFWNINGDHGSVVVWTLQSLPLLALTPGLYRSNYRSFSWLCFVVLFYFIFAVERSMLSTSGVTDYIFLALVVALFVASMMTGRWIQYTQKHDFIVNSSKAVENDV